VALASFDKRDLRPFGILRSVEWWFVADVSAQPIGPVLKDQEVQEFFLDFLATEGGADRFCRNVGTE
jgi:hypothetical protein